MAPAFVGAQVRNLCTSLSVIGAVAVSLRLLAQWKSSAAFGSDDVMIALSLFPLYCMIAIGYLAMNYGLTSLQSTTLQSDQAMSFLKLMMSGMIIYSVTITVVRLSLLLQYRRTFRTQAFKWRTNVIGIVCLAWFFVAIFTNIFLCRPFDAAFRLQLLLTYRCMDLQAYYHGIATVSLLLDLTLLALPLHMVWNLQLSSRQKVLVFGASLLGGLVIVAGMMRIIVIGKLRDENVVYSMIAEYEWGHVEVAAAIICASLLTYGPLCAHTNQTMPQVSSYFNDSSQRLTQDQRWTEMHDYGPPVPPKDYGPTIPPSLPQRSFKTCVEQPCTDAGVPPLTLMARGNIK